MPTNRSVHTKRNTIIWNQLKLSLGFVINLPLKNRDSIWVTRTDAIGDLVLSLPALGFLKAGLGPESEINLLVDRSNRDLAEWAQFNKLCTHFYTIDSKGVIESESKEALKPASAAISLVVDKRLGKFFKNISAEFTLGPRTKISSLWIFSESISQNRSRVEKSEMEYNLDLVRAFLQSKKIPVPTFTGLPSLQIPENWQFPRPHPHYWVLVVSNRGSAKNLPIEFYVKKAHEILKLDSETHVEFLVKGWDAKQRLEFLRQDRISKEKRVSIIEGFEDLKTLVGYLSKARGVVSSSTGPLHLAHALGVHSIGYYPKKKVESFKRWRPAGYWHRAPLEFFEIDNETP